MEVVSLARVVFVDEVGFRKLRVIISDKRNFAFMVIRQYNIHV